MTNCTSPYVQTSDAVFIVTNVVLQPLLFGAGIISNLLIIITLNQRLLRASSAVYVYLTGVSVCELLTLLVAVPRALRDTALIPLSVSHARHMAEYLTYEYVLRHALRDSATWLVVLALLVRYVTMTSPLQKHRLTTISASRIIVFVTAVFCLLLNFPRFFETQIVETRGHCMQGAPLWDWEWSAFARQALYRAVYPWIIVTVSDLMPWLLLIVLVGMIGSKVGVVRVLKRYVSLTSAADGNETQLSVVLVLTAVMYLSLTLTLRLLSNLLYAMAGLATPTSKQATPTSSQAIPTSTRQDLEYSHLTLITQSLSCLTAGLYFTLYMVLSRDIRKAFRRAFCCVCITGDDYYEPMTCIDILTCGYTYNRMPKDKITRPPASSRASTASSSYRTTPEPKEKYVPPPVITYSGPNVSKDGWI